MEQGQNRLRISCTWFVALVFLHCSCLLNAGLELSWSDLVFKQRRLQSNIIFVILYSSYGSSLSSTLILKLVLRLMLNIALKLTLTIALKITLILALAPKLKYSRALHSIILKQLKNIPGPSSCISCSLFLQVEIFMC